MKALYYIIFILLNFNSFGQNEIKTYNGKYGNNGIAIYQYFENDEFVRIYNGSFTYKDKYGTLTGNFLNNKKNGEWKCIINNKINVNEVEKIQIIGNYDNGYLTGKWKYVRQLYNNNVESLYELREANFDSSKFIKNMKYYVKKAKSIDSITLFFNNKGFIEGNYKVISKEYGNDFISNMTFNDGILCKLITIKNSTGEIIEKYDIKELVNNFITNNNSNNKIIEIDNIKYSCDKFILNCSNSDSATNFEFLNGGMTENNYTIYNINDNKYHDSQKRFKFFSLKDNNSHFNRYGNEKINSQLLFWLDLTAGNFTYIKENIGINYSLIFPKTSFYSLYITQYEKIKDFIIKEK